MWNVGGSSYTEGNGCRWSGGGDGVSDRRGGVSTSGDRLGVLVGSWSVVRMRPASSSISESMARRESWFAMFGIFSIYSVLEMELE
jgi:hypothetical protein